MERVALTVTFHASRRAPTRSSRRSALRAQSQAAPRPSEPSIFTACPPPLQLPRCGAPTAYTAACTARCLRITLNGTARRSQAAGARHFSLISAQGANKNLWASDFVLFHALLYCRVKGLAEEAARQQGFPSLSIYRPGLLLRGDMARGIERFMALIPGVGLQVDALALAAVKDAERRLEGAGDAQPVVTVFEGNGRILRASKDPDAA